METNLAFAEITGLVPMNRDQEYFEEKMEEYLGIR